MSLTSELRGKGREKATPRCWGAGDSRGRGTLRGHGTAVEVWRGETQGLTGSVWGPVGAFRLL